MNLSGLNQSPQDICSVLMINPVSTTTFFLRSFTVNFWDSLDCKSTCSEASHGWPGVASVRRRPVACAVTSPVLGLAAATPGETEDSVSAAPVAGLPGGDGAGHRPRVTRALQRRRAMCSAYKHPGFLLQRCPSSGLCVCKSWF